ncbi:endonuclease/exonuclease/phosphatase family protein [Phaeovulum sp.]|uniref:endonuclease/exonuclease/phosphatase family protein n=1 Tax=Phaeovulum sp. TaxID=2934796 RepID=UPI003561B850
MRIATYNVEWFTNLFDRRGKMLEDAELSSRFGVTRAEQLGALGIVFTALDADAIMIIEAPDNNRRRQTVSMLERFARHFGLRTRSALIGYANETQQEIALLYDPDVIRARHDPMNDAVPRFDGSYRIDLNIDAEPETVSFSKPPLEVAVTTKSGKRLRLIGVHIKSKAPHGASSPDAEKRLAIENRRKQLAQCIWLRERVEQHLAAGDNLIVLGDFNDGPGIDEFESLFGRSGVEIVLGETSPLPLRLREPHAHALLMHPTAAAPTTARFYLAEEGQYFTALLDYIMLSPGLCEAAPKWRIWHPFDDPVCYRTPELREALLQASDHFPVSVDLAL